MESKWSIYHLVIFSIEAKTRKRVQELEAVFDPEEKDFWELVFENEASKIYKVNFSRK